MQHLYLHVPFCVRRCSYCDFSIAVRKRVPVQEYVHALLTEAAALPEGDFQTVYFGGGTPSLLPPEAITTLLGKLLHSADPGPAARGEREVTLEANPEDVTPDHAKAWRA